MSKFPLDCTIALDENLTDTKRVKRRKVNRHFSIALDNAFESSHSSNAPPFRFICVLSPFPKENVSFVFGEKRFYGIIGIFHPPKSPGIPQEAKSRVCGVKTNHESLTTSGIFLPHFTGFWLFS